MDSSNVSPPPLTGRGVADTPQGIWRLESDLRISFLMLNEARYRAMAALFGLSREQTNLASLVLLGTVAHAIRERAHRMMVAWPAPTAGDSVLGVATLREAVQTVAGPASRDTSMFGTLVAIAAAGGVCLPLARRSLRAFEQASERAGAAFKHRYGHHAAAASRTMSQLKPGRGAS
jgi:hypothetical protein